MILKFIDIIPNDTTLNPVLISGAVSAIYSNQIFLSLSEDDIIIKLYEIKYDVLCSPFKEALLIDNLLAVGYEQHFYLFDLIANENILRLEMNGYFGYFYYDKEFFYIADACGLYCINKNGRILWRNDGLAIDGVIVHEFRDNKILGSGEFDPPGGWVDFSIDNATGNKTT
jgi:hypothetical protein